MQDGRLRPEALQVAIEVLLRHPERGGTAVLAALGERLRRYHRLHHARVGSALPLDAATREAVGRVLAAEHGPALSLEFDVHPELLAGIKAQVGYTVYDASVRGRMERLEQALLDR